MSELMTQFHFFRPWWLLAALPVTVVWWLLVRGKDPRNGLSDEIAPHLLNHLVTTPKDRPRIRPEAMMLPMALIAVVCLAGPAFRQQQSPFAEDKSFVMLVVKMTPSMLTADLQPTRLERARTKIYDLLELRKGAATGLIAYAGSAHLVMPPTTDSDVIDHMLEALDPKIMPAEGEALVDALQLAVNESKKSDTTGSILIVADGFNSAQTNQLAGWREQNSITVQWLAPVRDAAALQRTGISSAAETLAARPQLVTADDQDISNLARGADQAMVSGASGQDSQWTDDGYAFVPFLLLGVLWWCRRGWSVRDE